MGCESFTKTPVRKFEIAADRAVDEKIQSKFND